MMRGLVVLSALLGHASADCFQTYTADMAILGEKTKLANDKSGFNSPGYIKFGKKRKGTAKWVLTCTEASTAIIQVRYAQKSNAKELDVFLGGTQIVADYTFTKTGGLSKWKWSEPVLASLAAGDNEIVFMTTGDGAPLMDEMQVLEDGQDADSCAGTYETNAPDVLMYKVKENSMGVIKFAQSKKGFIKFNFKTCIGGTYDISFSYAKKKKDGSLLLIVNEDSSQRVQFPATGSKDSFSDTSVATVTFTAGLNFVTLAAGVDKKNFFVDSMTIVANELDNQAVEITSEVAFAAASSAMASLAASSLETFGQEILDSSSEVAISSGADVAAANTFVPELAVEVARFSLTFADPLSADEQAAGAATFCDGFAVSSGMPASSLSCTMVEKTSRTTSYSGIVEASTQSEAPSPAPSPAPTAPSAGTEQPTPAPTKQPTPAPTTSAPTTEQPTDQPTTEQPTDQPTTEQPTDQPTTVNPTASTGSPTTDTPTTDDGYSLYASKSSGDNMCSGVSGSTIADANGPLYLSDSSATSSLAGCKSGCFNAVGSSGAWAQGFFKVVQYSESDSLCTCYTYCPLTNTSTVADDTVIYSKPCAAAATCAKCLEDSRCAVKKNARPVCQETAVDPDCAGSSEFDQNGYGGFTTVDSACGTVDPLPLQFAVPTSPNTNEGLFDFNSQLLEF